MLQSISFTHVRCLLEFGELIGERGERLPGHNEAFTSNKNDMFQFMLTDPGIVLIYDNGSLLNLI